MSQELAPEEARATVVALKALGDIASDATQKAEVRCTAATAILDYVNPSDDVDLVPRRS